MVVDVVGAAVTVGVGGVDGVGAVVWLWWWVW